jgi:hypothetical protein
MYLHAGRGWIVVHHKEVVVVDGCRERLGSEILQAVGQLQTIGFLVQRQSFLIDIGIAEF